MRKEAKINEWKILYETATEIKELKPWDYFCDMDIIYLEDEDAYVSVLGHGGECYGISVYEGADGLDAFKILANGDGLNISPEFAMYFQNNLTCYWGNRDELSAKQRNIIKELGYTYRGKNQWLYFMSFKEGYIPYNQDADEVAKMTEYLSALKCAIKEYLTQQSGKEFEPGDMLCYSRTRNEVSVGKYDVEDVRFSAVDFADDRELMSDLKRLPKTMEAVEIEIIPLNAGINDKACDRPINSVMCLIVDSKSGMVIAGELAEPEMPALMHLANTFIKTLFQYGLPKKIYVSNVIFATLLENVCHKLKIKLEFQPFLPAVSEAINSFRRFMR